MLHRTVFAALLIFGLATGASAATLTFDLSTEFSGASDPGGPTPWVTITLDDSFGGADTVRVTISNVGLIGNEFNEQVVLNFDPSLDPNLLTFAVVDNSASVPTINTGVNAFMADGDGQYDIQFDFPPPPGNFNKKFTAGETVIYDITFTGGSIDVSSFNFLSNPAGGSGPFPAAAHVQGIDPNGNESGWITVPEPGLAGLLLIGLLGVTLRRP